MASTSSTPTDPSSCIAEDTAGKAVNKRYEGLVAVRTKATKGKGAWYWTHLEPILIRNPDTSLPEAIKLKCSLCEAVFSASNPSRTASEHLKRGTCPNFNSVLRANSVVSPLLISSFPSPPSHNHGKRTSHMANPLNSVATIESTRSCNELGYSNARLSQHQHLVLSGGKEDLSALAMLEDSIKKLKSPKASPRPSLSRDQIDSAFELLADWFYEVCGSVSFSSLEHPKFRAFLHQVGLPIFSRRELSGARLEKRFDMAKSEVEARIRDAMFFQVTCNGWKNKNCCSGEENLVKFSINLPNGTSLYQKTVLTGGSLSSNYAEEIMWEAVMSICGSALPRCVGIVADKYKAKALRNLEIQYQWMVNLSCQELDYAGLLRVPSSKCECTKDFTPVYVMLEDILSCARVLQMVVLDDSYKMIRVEDSVAEEIAGMIQNEGFWNDLEAVYSLMKLIREMAHEIEVERPFIGQCLPLWEDLKAKVKDWSARFNIVDGHVEKMVEKRFRKNYHPAWSAAFILDPLYLMRDASGKYLPPFKCLTHEQEKHVDQLITRLVSREEAHVALMELMKWRSEGLDPLYAQAVQVKQRDPFTGKMKIAHPQGSRLVWETCLSEYKALGKVAVRLIFLHATSCGFKCNRSSMKWVCNCMHRNSSAGRERAQKMTFIAAHAKLERRDFLNEEEKDGELLHAAGCEDDMLEVSSDALSL
ncbi:hypothetical protein GH714_026438 [Hevea brasiliensis]|uniref:DUF7963 domain-containing protein n=1 Tax=Hevea brasiliensis TaxID=3981 RepID=A0A6A6MDH2_HEVBR|nr:hypothetical protein GH714_026438 [Hevea brasiliensis]